MSIESDSPYGNSFEGSLDGGNQHRFGAPMTLEDTSNEEIQETRPLWSGLSIADLSACDLDEPVSSLSLTPAYEFPSVYRRAAHEGQKAPEEVRALSFMEAVMSLNLVSDDVHMPYRPQFVIDGRRSAIPDDFRSVPLEAMSAIAERVRHPTVKARVCDIIWLLHRKESRFGNAAITAYVSIVSQLVGESNTNEDSRIQFRSDARRAMSRALQISRSMGGKSEEAREASSYCMRLLDRAAVVGDRRSLRDLSELALRFGLSEPQKIGGALEASAGALQGEYLEAEALWRLAASAFQEANDQDSWTRCKLKAAGCLEQRAESAMAQRGSALLASHWMASAIAELHGVRDAKDRRKVMRHRLVDIQSDIFDEMSDYSHPIDLKEVAEQVEKLFSERKVSDLLFLFAILGRSPDPADLINDAKASIENHPLTSMFGSTHHDMDGKIKHRTSGASATEDTGPGSAIARQIDESERIRRLIHVYGKIQPARHLLATREYLSERTLSSLLRHSPFVPPGLVHTYSLGFARFFSGDFTSAIYILTPLLEASLRYVLKAQDHDVSKFDDATQTQQDLTISALFEKMRVQLKDIFKEPITAEIERVFLSKGGPGIRHEIAHGLFNDGSPHGPDAIYACWLIYHLCCLPLVPHMKEIDIDI